MVTCTSMNYQFCWHLALITRGGQTSALSLIVISASSAASLVDYLGLVYLQSMNEDILHRKENMPRCNSARDSKSAILQEKADAFLASRGSHSRLSSKVITSLYCGSTCTRRLIPPHFITNFTNEFHY